MAEFHVYRDYGAEGWPLTLIQITDDGFMCRVDIFEPLTDDILRSALKALDRAYCKHKGVEATP